MIEGMIPPLGVLVTTLALAILSGLAGYTAQVERGLRPHGAFHLASALINSLAVGVLVMYGCLAIEDIPAAATPVAVMAFSFSGKELLGALNSLAVGKLEKTIERFL